MTDGPRIGLALSGGGFRAACFGLGCLRALHDLDVLRHVRVISGVSGGSLLGALYAYGPADFTEFEDLVEGILTEGLQAEIVFRALRPDSLVRNWAHGLSAAAAGVVGHPVTRGANRSDALADTLDRRAFDGRDVKDVSHPDLSVVMTAMDLRTTNAVRFGNKGSSCSAYGEIQEPVRIATAVAASAAFPLLLPAIERRYTFCRTPTEPPIPHVLQMTDGGVYDNLGLSVFQSGRSSTFSPHTYEVDYVVSCDAGQGRTTSNIGHFLPSRLKRSFEATHRKAQDAARSRLHADQGAGLLQGFIQTYLGTPDDRIPVPIADLVPGSTLVTYPTDFRAMADGALVSLALRGEQVTRTLVAHYCPDI